MVCAGLGEGLLELGPRCSWSDPHCLGGCLQTVTARDGYCHLRLPMGQAESLPQRHDGRVIVAIRIAEEDDAVRSLITGLEGVRGANRFQRNCDQQERSQIDATVDGHETLRASGYRSLR